MSSAALYRKYRPQTFSQMIGQAHIKITLQRELERGETAHAYLFCGPRGLGKTTSARLFAKAINCQNRQAGESEPCNTCESCNDIMAGRSVDVIEIDAASNTGVDNVRENIIENSRFNPVRSKYKVYIIDQVHMLSISAFNALLKIMEEPPAHVIFILCTTEIHKIPPTIISRCQRFDFKKVTGEQLIKRLELVINGENKKVEDDVLRRIVSISEGCVRDAESLLTKVLSLGDDISADQADIVLPRTDFSSISNFVGFIAENNGPAAIELVNRLVEEGVDLSVFAEGLIEFLRRMILVKSSAKLDIFGIELSDDLSEELAKLSEKFNWNRLLATIELMAEKTKEIKQAILPQLPLEMAIVELIYADGKTPVLASRPAVAQNQPITPAKATPAALEQPAEPAKPSTANAEPAPQQSPQPQAIEPAAEPVAASTPESSIIEMAPEPSTNQETLATPSEQPAASPTTNSDVSLQQITDNWSVIVQSLLASNFTLGQLLKMSQPIRFDKGRLTIAVTTSFYKGRLESHNNREVMEKAIEAVTGTTISIVGEVSSAVVPIAVNIDYESVEQSAASAAAPAAKTDAAVEIMDMF